MNTYQRTLYIQKILPFINKPVIKVITGIRRSGKSYFLRQIIEVLAQQNVVSQDVLYINKESLKFDFIKNYSDLYNYVSDYFKDNSRKKYVFIDEIQEIELWEKTISSLFSEEDFDIYITGSNARLLSSEIATLIAGRYVEIKLYTLSFGEFLEFRGENKTETSDEFLLYLQYGGFPVIHYLDYNEEITFQYLNSLYNTILLKDIISRHKVRNVQLFDNITRYVFDNVGNIFSGQTISKYLKSQNLQVGLDTIQNYLQYLELTYLVYKVRRYDLKGKRILEISEKYYLGDIGLKSALLGYREQDISGMLENIVFLKLKQLEYEVFIGKYNDSEIDFIAQKSNQRIYIQVTYLLESEKTIEREFSVLKKINDNYPKYVLSMDKLPTSNNQGIIRMNLIEFLLHFS